MMPIFLAVGAGLVLAVGRGAGTGFIRFMADSYSGLLDRVEAGESCTGLPGGGLLLDPRLADEALILGADLLADEAEHELGGHGHGAGDVHTLARRGLIEAHRRLDVLSPRACGKKGGKRECGNVLWEGGQPPCGNVLWEGGQPPCGNVPSKR